MTPPAVGTGMVARVVSAAVLVPLALALVVYAPHWVFLSVVGVLGTFCLQEYDRLARGMGLAGAPWLTILAWWAILIGLRGGWVPDVLLLGLAVIAVFVSAMWRRCPLQERARGFAGDLAGIAYVGLCLYPIVPVRFDFGEEAGLRWLIVLFATIWAGDTAAMLTGKSLGRTPFSPSLSPKKTTEGAIGGLLGGTAAAVAVQQLLFRELDLTQVLVVSVATGVSGQLGDLAESLLKRAAGLKDSSALIPGHGGILDRVDSLMFALPVLYLCLSVIY